jgi:hypothetical protein
MQRSKMLSFFGIDRFGRFAGLTPGHRLMCSGFRAGGGKRWSQIFEQNFRVDKCNLPGLGCRVAWQLGEVGLIGRGAVKALMRARPMELRPHRCSRRLSHNPQV